ncbi:hypothetical protein [Arthrobacter woluwensis]|uniref:hypothetical protein n=1 Tax=Arthrobacter woluwensis TaxID=156980 RepID=UPI001AAE84D7|nr:hypothetical protein [Arthrobacter woluwensis]QTF71753.1 hypothetical protein G8758_06870 [Arthrobacter woluwensis]
MTSVDHDTPAFPNAEVFDQDAHAPQSGVLVTWGGRSVTRSRSPIFAQAAQDWAAMKAEFDAALEDAYWRAEEATNGYMVNRLGKAAGIAALDLFRGPESRAYTYASHELLEHWEAFPRPSLARFEAQWLDLRLWGEGRS